MTNTNSRTTRLTEFITALYPWAHGHQKVHDGSIGAGLVREKGIALRREARSPLGFSSKRKNAMMRL
jgi:pantoate kinase